MPIWHQRIGNLKAIIEIVNDRYRYEVYDHDPYAYGRDTRHQYGRLLNTGSADTLEETKSEAIAILELLSHHRPACELTTEPEEE